MVQMSSCKCAGFLCGLAVILKGGKWSLDDRRGGNSGETGAVDSDGEGDGEGCEIEEDKGADSLGMVDVVLEREKEEEGKSEMISPLS